MAIEIHGSHRLRVFKMLTTVSVGHTNDCSRKVPSLWCLTLLLAGLTVGVFPQGALALETVYATVRNQRSVRVINPTTNTFIGSPIAVGGGPREAVASPDGSRVYVVNSSNTTRDISVIETSTNTVTATIFVVFQPKDMVIAPDGKRGYVTVWGGASGLTPGSHIKVIDTDPCSSSYHAILDSISLSADLGVSTSLTITALAISPDGRLLYLTGSDKVFVMDTSANTLDDTFVLSGGSAQDIGISPDGSRLFVTHDSLTFGKVSAIDLATSSINPINVGGGLRGLAVTPDGSRVYAVDLGKFHVINTATDTFVTVFPGASRLEKVAFNSDGSRAYITVSNQYWVIVIDTDPGSGTYHTKLSTIAFGDSVIPHGITVASGGLGGPLPEAVCCQDADEDGYGQFGGPSCSNPGTDCDDGNADVYPGAVELCDGGDNDCNGQTDDGVAGVGEACNTGLPGVCAAGITQCAPPGGVACSVILLPEPEFCNGLDNDCNGAIDDGLGTTTCGLGECAHTVDNCIQGIPQQCDPLAGAAAEICDGRDNDCNGAVDDNIAPVPTTCGVGACAGNTGEETCAGGQLVDSCDPLQGSSPESCDSLDNDCDGTVDDNIAPVPTTCGVGVCAGNTGEDTCAGGQLVDSCDPLQGSSPEACDSLDNDCNGAVDDNIAPVPTTCGVGVCAGNTGEETCAGGQLVDSCDPLQGSSPESCDSLDNDCDGIEDEGTLVVTASVHTVGAGPHPGSNRTPLADLDIGLFDKTDGSCAREVCGGISWQHYPCIVVTCSPVAAGTTDATGQLILEMAPGEYLVVGDNGSDKHLGGSLGEIACGASKKKRLDNLVTAEGKDHPAKATKRTGSELWIIEPEYVEWTGEVELYPIVLESVGDWEVTTSVAPPEGFVSDHEELSEEVTTETEAVQFTITDVGSDWIPTEIQHDLRHHGRKEKVLSRVGVELAPGLAQAKGLDRHGHPLDENGEPIEEPGFDPRAERPATLVGWVEPADEETTWTLKLRVETTCEVVLAITRGQGLVERLLVSGSLEPGEYEIQWNGLDDDGDELKPGVHSLTLLADEVTEKVKLIEN